MSDDDIRRAAAEAIIDAVRPLIEADLRERLAAAIEVQAADVTAASGYIDATDYAYANGLTDAAHLVRNRP